jgi:ADP-heptose:LPS heptosyltransferase
VIAIDRSAMRRSWFKGSIAFTRLACHLRRQRFDLAIDLQGLLRSGLMAIATGARHRLGLASAREGARWCHTQRIDDVVGVQHAVDGCWRVAEALGASGEKRYELPVDPVARQEAIARLGRLPRPWIVVAAGARWLTKRWPPEHFAALLRRAQAQFGGSAVLVGSPDEADVSRQIGALVHGPAGDLTGHTSLPQLAALLAEADVVLANDTGPLHVAVALGRPIVSPYTCTQVALNGPYGQFDRAVETNVWCKGSYRKRCDRLDCMAELTPDRLWPRLAEVLSTWQRERRCA